MIPSPAPGRSHRAARRGQTLLELMVAITVMAVLAGMTVPTYRRSIEQTKVDVAASNLREIWAAERLIFLESRSYTADPATLADAGAPVLARPELDPWYRYEVNAAAAGFVATATRWNSAAYSGSLTIDQAGVLSGTIDEGGGASIRPGFQ